MSRRPWLSGLSALVVLLASLVAAEIRPQAAGTPSWQGGWHAPADPGLALGADRGDVRLVRALGGRPRLAGAGPAHTPPPFALTFALPAPFVLPAPQIGRAWFHAFGGCRADSSRPAAHGARGPPARTFI